jgi:hypothetical protein
MLANVWRKVLIEVEYKSPDFENFFFDYNPLNPSMFLNV